MNAITFTTTGSAAPRSGEATWRGVVPLPVVTTAFVALAAVLGFVGSVAWAA